MKQKVSLVNKVCSYCSGTGYLQLLLGGSETCQSCYGSGLPNNNQIKMEARAPLHKVFHMVLNSRH